MTDPIRRDPSHVDELFAMNPSGASREEVRQGQRPSLEGAKELLLPAAEKVADLAVEHVTEHLIEKVIERVLEKWGYEVAAGAVRLAGRANLYTTAITEGVELELKLAVDIPARQGEELNKGLVSDNARLAMEFLIDSAAPDALPAGYVDAHNRQLTQGTQGVSAKMATLIAADANKGDPEAIAFRQAIVRISREGCDAAYRRDIDSNSKLEQICKEDPGFAKQYATNPAFQIGVRSAIWQAKAHPDAFQRGVRTHGEIASQIQLARGA